MKRRVSAMEARRRLGELLEGVYYRGDEVVIERAGKPMGVVIPAARYESLEGSRERLRRMLEANWAHNAGVPEEELQRDVDAAIREVRSSPHSAR